MKQSTQSGAISRVDAKRLAHELRNHLYVISLGLTSLEMTRTKPEAFAAMLERIRKEGLGGVEGIADALEGDSENSPRPD